MTPARRRRVDETLVRRQPDLTVLMEAVHKPHNFSAIVRSCDAVGIHEVHAVAADGQLPRHNHTSQGAEKWVKVRQHDDVIRALDELHEAGFATYAAHLSERAVDYRAIDYTRPTAVVMGSELEGVSETVCQRVSGEIVIPMMGMTQSLNVSVACAVILFEAQAQRLKAGCYEQRRLPGDILHDSRFRWLHPRLADYCDRHDLALPALDESGELIEPFPPATETGTEPETKS